MKRKTDNLLKRKAAKFALCLVALAIFAGAGFLCAAFSLRLPRGVVVNGTDVGGMTRACAARVLRGRVEEELKDKRLRICSGERVYEYTFPEIYYADDFCASLDRVNRKGEYTFPVFYYLNGAESVADYICADAEIPVVEPYAAFNAEGEPFDYYAGNDGAEADRQKLLEDVSSSLNGDFGEVTLSLRAVRRRDSLAEVRERTVRLYSFTTYFDPSNTARAANIRLAAEKINGTILAPGGAFSFNGAVGPRTAENGFRQAKIIEDGRFVLGFGGGVCQVSTTLYNAALLSGLKITEYHPHSLAVGYVAPSRDAMVSGSYCDLKFVNDRASPIYLRAKCTSSSVTCTVYGKSDGYNYSFLSEVTGAIPRPACEEIEGEEDKVLSVGKDGTLSSGYLVREKDGKREEKLIRRDRYAPVAEVRQVKRQEGDALPQEENKERTIPPREKKKEGAR